MNTEEIKKNLQAIPVQQRIALAKLMDGEGADILPAALALICSEAGNSRVGEHMIQKAMYPIWQSMAVESELSNV